MKQYKEMTKDFLAEYTDALRKRRELTQEKMAEQLHITSRAYGDLERGKYCFSTVALLFFLLMLGEEEMKEFLNEFRRRIEEAEHEEVVA